MHIFGTNFVLQNMKPFEDILRVFYFLERMLREKTEKFQIS